MLCSEFKILLTFLQLAYFDIEYQSVEQTAGDKDNFLDISNLKVRKVPGTKSLDLFGPVIIHGKIDNSFIIKINMYVKQFYLSNEVKIDASESL